MLEYQYITINEIGRKIKGSLLALNYQDAEHKLAAKNLVVIKLKLIQPGLVLFDFNRVKSDDLIHFTFQLEQLLKAGVPLMDALNDLTQIITTNPLHKILQKICTQMEDGASFSEALTLYPKVFDEIYISLIRVGEQTGRLEQVLQELLSMLEWEKKLISKLTKLMIYPSILFTLVILVVSLMMLFVVPELVSFIQEMGGELSFATKSLIAVSSYLQDFWHFILIGVVGLLGLVQVFKLISYSFRLRLSKLKLNFWLIGEISYQIKIARFSRSLAIMYQAGINITDAIPIANKVLNNEYLEAQIDLVAKYISEGYAISQAFLETNSLSNLALRMVKVGEQTGRLDEALFSLSTYYDTQTNQKVDKLEPAIEPALTLVMGLVVGWIMLAVLGPVYSLISDLNI